MSDTTMNLQQADPMNVMRQLAADSQAELLRFVLSEGGQAEFPNFKKLVEFLQTEFRFGDPFGFEDIVRVQYDYWHYVSMLWTPKRSRFPSESYWILFQGIYHRICTCMQDPCNCREDALLEVATFCSCLKEATDKQFPL